MTLKQIVEECGGSLPVATFLGVRPSTVRVWMHDGYIPERHRSNMIDMAKLANIEITSDDLDEQRVI